MMVSAESSLWHWVALVLEFMSFSFDIPPKLLVAPVFTRRIKCVRLGRSGSLMILALNKLYHPKSQQPPDLHIRALLRTCVFRIR
jgi:hypothetical protein